MLSHEREEPETEAQRYHHACMMARRHYNIAITVMQWHTVEDVGLTTFADDDTPRVNLYKSKMLKGTPAAITSSNAPTIYDHIWAEWEPSTDPVASEELRRHLRAHGFYYSMGEAHSMNKTFLCRLTHYAGIAETTGIGATPQLALFEAAEAVALIMRADWKRWGPKQ